MKPGSKDIKVFLKFTQEELDLLQENTWQMAESFGLDTRIDNLTVKRKVGVYSWDLECLEMVVEDLKNQQDVDQNIVNGLHGKIQQAIDSVSE